MRGNRFNSYRAISHFSIPRDMFAEAEARYHYSWENALGWIEEQYRNLYKFAASESKDLDELENRVALADMEFLCGQGSLPFAGFCVYSLFDTSGALLYVGQSQNPWKRVGNHASKEWGSRIASVRLIRCASRVEALELEARMILELEPPCNIVGKWRSAS